MADVFIPAEAAGQTPKPSAPRRNNAARLFGYDVFISFALGPPPRGTHSYASDLARRLRERDLTVFFSEDEAAPGEQLDSTLRKALLSSRTLVVIANRGTLEEPRWVRTEVETFRDRYADRPIIPISVGGALRDTTLAEHTREWLKFQDKIWLDETDDAVANGIASKELVERLALAPAGRSSNVKWRWVVRAVVTVLAVLTVAAVAFGIRAQNQSRQAKARELAAYATGSLDEDPERSIVLGMYAVNATNAMLQFGQNPVSAAEESLHQAILSSRVRLTLKGHDDAVTSVAWSPDGRRLATGSDDKTAKVWDAVSGQELLTLKGHSDYVRSLAWSPDGKRLATASGQAAMVWEVEGKTGELNEAVLTLKGHDDAVTSVAWSPDGKRLATGSGRSLRSGIGFLRTGEAKVWDAASGQELLTLEGHDGKVNTVAWSPDSQRLATASGDKTVKVWDAATGRELLTLRRHTGSVLSVAWSPDGKRLATGGGDQTAKVWDATSGQELLTLEGHEDKVLSVAWSPDGQHLATGSYDQTARVWDAASGQESLTLKGHTRPVYSVAWSPGGKRLATGSSDSTAKVWDAASGHELPDLEGHNRFRVTTVAWSREGKWLATGSGNGAKVWDAASGKGLLTLNGHTGEVTSVAWSPDGKRLATASADKTAKVWDAASGQPSLTLEGHDRIVTSVAWSPDGKRLATGSEDKTAKVWDAASGQPLPPLKGHADLVYSVVWSPDGKRLATGSEDKTAKVWDAASGQELLTLRGHNDAVTSVAWSPDGKRLATAGKDGIVQVYAIDIHELLKLARSRVTRDLTEDECIRYFQSKKCPPMP
jgi:WD40 repeat protein